MQRIKDKTRGEQILIHEITNPKKDDYQYVGYFQNVFGDLDVDQMIDRAADLITEIRSQIEPELANYDKIIGLVSKTEREQLIRARVGQSKFCRDVRTRWQRCAVTGCSVREALRASHIVSWKSSEKDRLNPNNGLLLIATIDVLFDQGLISFDDNGLIVISPRLNDSDQKTLGLHKALKIRGRLNKDHRRFLRHHRERYDLKA